MITIYISKLSSSFDFSQPFTISDEFTNAGDISFIAQVDRTRAEVITAVASYLDGRKKSTFAGDDMFFISHIKPTEADYMNQTAYETISLGDKNITIPVINQNVSEKYVWGGVGLLAGLIIN